MTDEFQTRAPNGQKVADIVIRLDERTARMAEDMTELRKTIVTQAEFKPIRAVVYGLIAIVMTSVITALVALVVQKGG